MPALAKVALATALALPLVGGAAALAPSTATEGHTRYVTLTLWEDPTGETQQTLTGTVPCEAGLGQRLARAWMSRPACTHEGYAWAYPKDHAPPWEGEIEHVNDTRHVTEDGQVYHTTEIVYRTMTEGPGGGVQRVHAVAGELKPVDRADSDGPATYSLPVSPTMLDTDGQALTVTVHEAPQPTLQGAA